MARQKNRRVYEIEKKKLIKAVVFGLPLVLIIMYLSGFMAQLVGNYKAWSSAGHFAGDGTFPEMPSAAVASCLKNCLTNFPYNMYGIFLCLIIIGILILLIAKNGGDGLRDSERNFNYSSDGSYGTSGFMTDKERVKVLDSSSDIKSCNGTILESINNKIISVPLESRMNKNIAVYGASGSMKSRAFARNMIFQCVKRGESLVVTDPKSGAKRCNIRIILQVI